MLIVGYNKSAKFNEWKRQHATASQLLNTQLVFQGDATVLVYKAAF